MSVLAEVLRAAERLPEEHGVQQILDVRPLFDRALATFTSGQNLSWWWTGLPESAVFCGFPKDDGFRHLLDVVPEPDAPVLFVIEDDDEPFFPFLQATPRAAQAIVADTFAYEYYLIDPAFTWLVGESHHSELFASGEPVAPRLRQLRDRLAAV